MTQNLSVVRRYRRVTSVALLGIVAACGETRPTDPLSQPALAESWAVSLVPCPTGESRAAQGRVTPAGGGVGLDRNRVVVPQGAVLDTSTVTIETPASSYLLVEFRVDGHEHHQFLAPLAVTLDYARCPADQIARGDLSVWLVDPATGELLQNMGGVDDRSARTITFYTDHFSGYAIAN